METIRGKRLVGSWSLALCVGSGALIAGCGRAEREASEQRPIAPQVAPPIEQQDAERAARDESLRIVVFGEEVGRQHARKHAPRAPTEKPGAKDRTVKGFQGELGYLTWATPASLQERVLHGGFSDSPGSAPELRSGMFDVAPRPILPAGAQQPYQFWTPDQTRRGHGLRVDSVEPPSYSTMPPITPNVSESTVLPEMQSGASSFP